MAKEPGKKERFEVLLEQVRKELELVAEGYVALDQKIDRWAQEMRQGFTTLDTKIELYTQQLSKRMDVDCGELRQAVAIVVKRMDDHERITH